MTSAKCSSIKIFDISEKAKFVVNCQLTEGHKGKHFSRIEWDEFE